jgi:hypothetical protein
MVGLVTILRTGSEGDDFSLQTLTSFTKELMKVLPSDTITDDFRQDLLLFSDIVQVDTLSGERLAVVGDLTTKMYKNEHQCRFTKGIRLLARPQKQNSLFGRFCSEAQTSMHTRLGGMFSSRAESSNRPQRSRSARYVKNLRSTSVC